MPTVDAQITFNGLRRSLALEADIQERVQWLMRFHRSILGCRVLVELPHRHRRRGRHFHVRVEVALPRRRRIVVTHEPEPRVAALEGERPSRKNARIVSAPKETPATVVHQAFAIARRRLREDAKEQAKP